MSITARILAWLTALVVIAVLVIGSVTVTTTRSAMIEQLDELILEAAGRPASSNLEGPGAAGPAVGGRSVAILRFDEEGNLLGAFESGLTDDLDPLPDIADSALIAGALSGPPKPIVAGSVGDTGLRYRAVAVATPAGVTVAAASMADVDDTTDSMVAALISVGGLVVVALLAGAWLAIRNGLRPVHDIAATAKDIAEGDLSIRTEHVDPRTEVGQLGAAFNYMAEEVQAAMAQREDTEGRLRRFAADASHELRTPLVSVRGYAELYRVGALNDPDKLGEAMARIEGETKRMGRLIDDLLLLARLDQRRPLDLAQVDLAALAGDAVADARAVEPDRRIELACEEDVTVLGDVDRLRQVFGNLLSNTRTHTSPDTPVRVEVKTDASGYLITVSDEGLGIEPEQADRIFDRFYRADKGRSRSQGGSGLGLSIVAAIAAAHGGEASVESSPGQGTSFTVSIPRAGFRGTGV
ncbi:MAG: HAMP domain-containing sensor histidine kinase [Acidimicrobiia bacterium]|nr:HAMP domain-containing sensor histidine kinase [Acidimicrobiia bacterium]MDX2468239.1 HAMP domain-containing sensor histidine kinase [Acidimicrobiia bacterium]